MSLPHKAELTPNSAWGGDQASWVLAALQCKINVRSLTAENIGLPSENAQLRAHIGADAARPRLG